MKEIEDKLKALLPYRVFGPSYGWSEKWWEVLTLFKNGSLTQREAVFAISDILTMTHCVVCGHVFNKNRRKMACCAECSKVRRSTMNRMYWVKNAESINSSRRKKAAEAHAEPTCQSK